MAVGLPIQGRSGRAVHLKRTRRAAGLAARPAAVPAASSPEIGGGMKIIRGRKAFVTGAASGIGRALALALACEGADVFLVDLDGDKLEDTAAAARSPEGKGPLRSQIRRGKIEAGRS